MTDQWKINRHARNAAKKTLAAVTNFPTPCASGISPRCSIEVAATDNWVAGHKVARTDDPTMVFTAANLQVECRACSDSQGARMANAGRLADGKPLWRIRWRCRRCGDVSERTVVSWYLRYPLRGVSSCTNPECRRIVQAVTHREKYKRKGWPNGRPRAHADLKPLTFIVERVDRSSDQAEVHLYWGWSS